MMFFCLGDIPKAKKYLVYYNIMGNFKEFLLENSSIKKTFINDFFEIIREDYFEISEQFLINSNKLQAWLNITSRKDFHLTIKNSYRINIDYIITNNKDKIGKGGKKKKIYIFKALNTEETLYKLGKSKNIRKRLNSHNSALANDLLLVHEFDTDNMHGVEQCIKGLMRVVQYRKYKEVYQVDLDILKKFLKHCDDSINFIKELSNKSLTDKDKIFMHIPIYDK